jgi:hypothetical protein
MLNPLCVTLRPLRLCGQNCFHRRGAEDAELRREVAGGSIVKLVTHLALCYLIVKHREENCRDYFGYCRKSA